MKRVMITIVFLLMSTVFSSCGGGSDFNPQVSTTEQVTDASEQRLSKEEMEKQAQDFSISTYMTGMESNPVRTNDTYRGKYVRITGQVSAITSEKIVISDLTGSPGWPSSGVSVKLTNEEIKKVSKGNVVMVVGLCTPDEDQFLSDAYLLDEGYYTVTAQISNVPFVSTNRRLKPEVYDCYRLVSTDKNLVILFDDDSVDVQNQMDSKRLEFAGEKAKEGDKFDIIGMAKYTTLDDTPAIKFSYGAKVVKHK